MPGTTAFPAALDTFPEIGPNTPENGAGVEHDVVHENVHAAVAALQAKVGIDGSVSGTSLDFRIGDVEDAADALDVRVTVLEEAPAGGGIVEEIIAGDGITVDSADPARPIVSAVPVGGQPGGVSAGWDGGGDTIASGHSQRVVCRHAGTIVGWRLLGGVGETGTAIVDVAVNGVSIVAAAPPTVTAANDAASSTLTGWTTALALNDVVTFTVTAASFEQLLCTLLTVKS